MNSTDKADSNPVNKGVEPQSRPLPTPSGQVEAEPAASASKSEHLPPPPRRHPFRLLLIVVLCLAIFTVAVANFLQTASPYRSTDDAYVQGNQISLTPRVTGTVVAINADDTDLVKKGQPLVILDNTDAKVSLQQAEAALGDTMRKVCQFYVNVGQMKANVDNSKITLARAEDDHRRRTAVQNGSVSVEEITHAQQGVDAARDGLQFAEQQLAAAEALIADTDLEHHPMVFQAEANVLDADLALQRTVVNAPETGYVARRSVQIGQRVTPGTSLLTIIPLDQIWVDANFKEEQLKDMRIGQPVELTADFYGGSIKYEGHVAGLGAGTGAAFALLPPQEASGNWIKIVQRLPVRIILNPKQLEKFPLRLGLTMRAVVNTRDRNGEMLAQTASDKPVYATSVYSNEWANANELVQRLVEQNLHALSNLTVQSSTVITEVNDKIGVAHE